MRGSPQRHNCCLSLEPDDGGRVPLRLQPQWPRHFRRMAGPPVTASICDPPAWAAAKQMISPCQYRCQLSTLPFEVSLIHLPRVSARGTEPGHPSLGDMLLVTRLSIYSCSEIRDEMVHAKPSFRNPCTVACPRQSQSARSALVSRGATSNTRRGCDKARWRGGDLAWQTSLQLVTRQRQRDRCRKHRSNGCTSCRSPDRVASPCELRYLGASGQQHKRRH